jgi:DNA-binding IclR family transcriptional regulator
MVKVSDEAHQSVGSVENALRTLQLLRDRHAIRVSEVATHLGVARSTAHRLLTTLATYGAVEQEPSGPRYLAGPLLAQLGLATLRKHDLVQLMHPYLERLSEELAETVQLIVLNGRDAIFVDCAECRTQALRVTARVGLAYPAYANSGGKVLLAELTDDAIRELFSTGPFTYPTDRTIRDVDALLVELDGVRERGFATSWGEGEMGIAAVAVAQLTRTGSAAAALAVSAPEHRLPLSRLNSLVARLKEVSAEVAPLLT